MGLHSMVAAARQPPAAGSSVWTLDTLPLPEPIESWARQLVADLALFKAGKLKAEDLDKGAMIYGEAGTGKTTLAIAIANSASTACKAVVPLIVGGYAIWEGGEDNKSSYSYIIKNMRASFSRARERVPSIIFIDELDAFIARGRAGHNESWFRPILSALLAELDGITRRDGVVVLAATNLPDEIDGALRRVGRLDRELEMTLPDDGMLRRIFAVHIPDLAASDLSAAASAAAALRATGADCARLSREARRRARLEGRPVEASDLLSVLGVGKDTRAPALRRRIACHEAGHAICCAFNFPGSVESVSIRVGSAGRHSQGGILSTLPQHPDHPSRSLHAILCALMGGMAAERVVFGEAETGSGEPGTSDLALATIYAASAEASWGMGDRLLWRGNPTIKTLPTLLAAYPDVAVRVEERLRNALEDAVALIKRNRAIFDSLMEALLERESLTGEEVEAVLDSPLPAKAGEIHPDGGA